MTKRNLLLGGLAFVVLLALVHELAKTPTVSTASSLAPLVTPPPPPLNMADYR